MLTPEERAERRRTQSREAEKRKRYKQCEMIIAEGRRILDAVGHDITIVSEESLHELYTLGK